MKRTIWTLPIVVLTALSASGQENRQYTSKTGNFRILYPDSWRRGAKPHENFEVVLTKGMSAIMIAAAETNATPEDIAREVETNTKVLMEGAVRDSHHERSVGGERSIEDRFSVRNQGFEGDLIVSVFSHQGIAYRVVGVSPNADEGEFLSDYRFVLKNFAFVGDRKEWLKKSEGSPSPLAMLGGRIEFQLNRPRWQERTFEEETSWQSLDYATFVLFAGGAWLTVEAQKVKGPPDQELNRLGHDLGRCFTGSRIAVARADLHSGPGWSVSVQGQHNGEPRFLRGLAIVQGDIVVRAWIECQESRREDTVRDWKQLAGSLVFHPEGAGPQPPAWIPADAVASKAADTDPVIAASRRLLTATRVQTLLSLSPDLTRAAFLEDDKPFVEDLITGSRIPLPESPAPGSTVAWSADRNFLALCIENRVSVVDLRGGTAVEVDLKPSFLSFGLDGHELLAVEACADPSASFRTSTLLRVPLNNGKRETVLSFPLSRVTCAALSPDGTRLAVATNERLSRRSESGSNLFVGGVHAGGLKNLTDGPEEVSAIAWTPDGSSILALRRLAVDANGLVPGWGGPKDVWKIPAQGGEAVNLTRCGSVSAFVLAGDRLALVFDDWRRDESARGVFEIRLPDLEAASSTLPLPAPLDPIAHSRAIAARMAPVLKGRPLGDIVPSREFVAELAETFARAAVEICSAKLDFSAESLDVFSRLLGEIEATEPLVLAAAGAYYGETLRKVSGATWSLGAESLQVHLKSSRPSSSLAVDVVQPWADVADALRGSEDTWLLDAETARAESRRKPMLLVHPPGRVADAIREFEGGRFLEALRFLDTGDVTRAIPLLLEEMRRFPRNDELALYVISACDAAGLEQEARKFVADAVEAGTESIALLVRRADELKKSDPAKALELYRRATKGRWGTCDAFIKLGKCYREAGQRALAESCWRRGWRGAEAAQQAELRKLLGELN